jgi:hypothetical protein
MLQRVFSVAFALGIGALAYAQDRLPRPEPWMNKEDYYNRVIAPRLNRLPVQKGLSGVQAFEDRKLSVLDVGNVRARISNAATLGYDRWGLCYEFPFNSGFTYRWTMAPIIGAKKRMPDGSFRKMVASGTRGAARFSEEEFQPLPGYDAGVVDIQQNIGIAFSDKPASWPARWPTIEDLRQKAPHALHAAAEAAFRRNPLFDPVATATARLGAKGFPGVVNGEMRAAREAYFVVTDNDPQQGNAPEPMHIRVDLWGLQWDNFVNRDFIIYRMVVTNVGPDTLYDVYVGIHDDPDCPEQGSIEWTDDFAYFIPQGKDEDADGVPDPDADPRSDVDGDGRYTDADRLLWNTVYLWDGDDRVPGLIAKNVGWVGLKFMETPVNPQTGKPMGITTLDIFAYTSAPQSEETEYDQLSGFLHGDFQDRPGQLPAILPPHNVQPHPNDVTQTPNSYGPDITLVVASGPFTLAPGQSLPFTFASVHGRNKAELLKNVRLCQLLFDQQYKSALPPPTPVVWAVPGDGQVTLYWDDRAERGVYPDGTVGDPLTGNNAFEGYMIFRSDDRGKTWGEVMVDAQGTPRGFIPLAQYDVKNGVTGESDTRPFFYLGSDTGLRHSFVDRTVRNGVEYWYAVVAYDRDDGPIPPLENAINTADPYAPGDNTVAVVPMPRPAGKVGGEVDPEARRVAGSNDVPSFPVELIDPSQLQEGPYRITFSLNEKGQKLYTVRNVKTGQIPRNTLGEPMQNVPFYNSDLDNAPIFDGVRVIVTDVSPGVKNRTWTAGGNLPLPTVTLYRGTAENRSWDYEIRFVSGTRTYVDFDNGTPVVAPFEVWDITNNRQITCEIRESTPDWGNGNGQWDPGERIYLVTKPYTGSGAWEGDWPADYPYYVVIRPGASYTAGAVFRFTTNKPINVQTDAYEFNTRPLVLDASQAALDVEEIRVVPNPFIVSSAYETSAFGIQKQIQFHGLPERCTIRIYTVSGELVQIIQHEGGSIARWNLQNYLGQEVAYGVYIYHVEAPQMGLKKTGKFAVLK